MKHLLLIITICVAAMTAVTSCRVRPLNGDLDAQWQLMTIEYPSGRTETMTRSYYCFYRHTVNLRGAANIHGNLIYDEATDSLIIDLPDGHDWLGHWGIQQHTPCRLGFKVVELSGKRLVMLHGDSALFTFRKF